MEDHCAVLCTLNTLKEINEKVQTLFKNETDVTKGYFKNIDEIMADDEERYDKNEIKKLLMLSTLNSCLEQNDKVLLLLYLLKVSVEQQDNDDFAIVAETLYYLSQLRRFNDSFLSVLEEITYFSSSHKDINRTMKSEVEGLFINETDFFEEDVSPQGKIYYLGFL